MDFIVFESGQAPRVLSTRATVDFPRVTDINGKNLEVKIYEYKDAREDDIFGYMVLYDGEQPTTQQIINAIDCLKPKGEIYHKP